MYLYSLELVHILNNPTHASALNYLFTDEYIISKGEINAL